MAKNKDRTPWYPIPVNFHTGISIFGHTVDTVYLLQTLVLVLPGWVLIFYVLPNLDPRFNFEFSVKLSCSIVWSFIFGYLCINGISERPLFQYISSMFAWRKSRLNAYYNPRVKTEARPSFIKDDRSDLLPRDRLIKVYNKYKATYDKKQRENVLKEQENMINDRSTIYFTDDIGVMDKPVEYMTPKEYKKYLKLQKKEEKKRLKAEKKKRKGEKAHGFTFAKSKKQKAKR